MTQKVTDVSGNRQDKIANAAKVIGRSKDRLKVFSAIYSGKRIKTVSEIIHATDLTNKIRVLQEGKKLASEDIVNATKVDGETGYEKIDFYTHNKNRIISLVKNKEKLKKFPTKTNPQLQTQSDVVVRFNRSLVNIDEISIDKIDSFSKAQKQKGGGNGQFYEKDVKEVFKKAIGENGKFTDWGGETDDLYTTRLKLKGKRVSAAFGLKGRGTKGVLTPKKMGKNGDQIQRLFKSPAEAFFVQYNEQIAESVIDQMKSLAIAKSVMENRKIYYGIIDGDDTSKIMQAYDKNKSKR